MALSLCRRESGPPLYVHEYLSTMQCLSTPTNYHDWIRHDKVQHYSSWVPPISMLQNIQADVSSSLESRSEPRLRSVHFFLCTVLGFSLRISVYFLVKYIGVNAHQCVGHGVGKQFNCHVVA